MLPPPPSAAAAAAAADAAAAQSNLFSIYLAHRDWDWATKEGACNGRDKLPAVRLHGPGSAAQR